MTDFGEVLDGIEVLIRDARSAEALRLLQKLTVKSIPKRYVLRAALLAQRLNQVPTVLRLLHGVVRPNKDWKIGGTEEEQAEYAVALMRFGVRQEARKILNQINAEKFPKAYLYRAHLNNFEWNYAASIPLLETFCKKVPPTDYAHLVARTNLAGALVFVGRNQEATKLLGELLVETHEKKARLLYNHVLQFSAQNLIQQKNWGLTEVLLKRAEADLAESSGFEGLFVQKWKAVMEISRHGAGKKQVAGIAAVRQFAEAQKHWETIRDCDRTLAMHAGDKAALAKVYFGTPHEAYRADFAARLGDKFVLPASYLWQPQNEKAVKTELILEEGRVTGSRLTLEPGQAPHRLLSALVSDFYRPLPTAGLHSLVYPDEIFHPLSSATKVYRLVQRLREFFKKSRAPFTIVGDGDGFRLESKSGGVRVKERAPIVERDDVRFAKAKSAFADKPFKRVDIQKCLELSQPSASRFLLWALEEGLVEKTGRGPASGYKIKAA